MKIFKVKYFSQQRYTIDIFFAKHSEQTIAYSNSWPYSPIHQLACKLHPRILIIVLKNQSYARHNKFATITARWWISLLVVSLCRNGEKLFNSWWRRTQWASDARYASVKKNFSIVQTPPTWPIVNSVESKGLETRISLPFRAWRHFDCEF